MRLTTQFVRIITYAGIVQGSFLAFVLTMGKNKGKKSNKILALLLVFVSVEILHADSYAGYFAGPYRMKAPFVLAFGPLLFLYVGEFTHLRDFSRKDLIHLVPFLIFFGIAVSGEPEGAGSSVAEFLYKYSFPIAITTWTLIVVHYGFYWLAARNLIRRNELLVQREFSNVAGKTLSSVRKVLIGFGALFLLLASTVLFAAGNSDYAAVGEIVSVALSIMTFWLGYEGIFQEDIIRE